MAKPFDATTKYLVESNPGAWLAYLGLPASGPASVVNPELSTIAAEADHVLRVEGPSPWLLHLEFQASHDAALPQRLLRYNVLVSSRHEAPVWSIVVLLRQAADGPGLSGAAEQRLPWGDLAHTFRYGVMRLWRQPLERALSGGLTTLPLAPLTDEAQPVLPEVIRRLDERISREADPAEAATLWTATYLLLGLRHSREVANRLLQGVRAMRESSTYQAILLEGEEKGRAEGRVEEARNILRMLGEDRLGQPDALTSAAIDSLTDVERIEALTRRLLRVSSWAELLASG